MVRHGRISFALLFGITLISAGMPTPLVTGTFRTVNTAEEALFVQQESINCAVESNNEQSTDVFITYTEEKQSLAKLLNRTSSALGDSYNQFGQKEGNNSFPFNPPSYSSQTQEKGKLYSWLACTLDDSGNLNRDSVTGIATDSVNSIIVVGRIAAARSAWDLGEDWAAFISRFSPAGEWVWSLILDASSDDEAYDVAIDHHDNIVVLGTTTSEDFPTTPDAYDRSYNGRPSDSTAHDLFLIKYTREGTLLWSTYLGGLERENGGSVAIDNQDNIIVVGTTSSDDFPTKNAYDSSRNGGSDIIISKFNSSGALLWSTYFGGSSDEVDAWNHRAEMSVAIDRQDNLIVTSLTKSDDFPTKDAYQDFLNPDLTGSAVDYEAFISKFNSTGGLVWSTYLGGSASEEGSSVITDSQDNVVVVGRTASTDFPTKDAYNNTFGGIWDVFVSKFNSTGALLWSTYLGGNDDDYGLSITTASQDRLIVTGYTTSVTFPTLPDADNSTYSGKKDVFVAIFDSAGVLLWSTFLGGTKDDIGSDVAVDGQGNILVAGRTTSVDFPTSGNIFPYSFGGSTDGFIAKFSASFELEWSTRAPVVTEPASDLDDDGLTNSQEFMENLDPLNNDTDRDGMADGWELQFVPALSPLYNDSWRHDDPDNLTNLQEFYYDLDPTKEDTDNDTMWDDWEVQMGLNGNDPGDAFLDKDEDGVRNFDEFALGLNATNLDTDGDLLPDGWEVEYTLNGTFNDAEDDPDGDGLTNLEEYQRHLDPTDEDTDADGMPDGWEVDNDLNPRRNDADEDADGDFLPNGLEYALGFEPQDPRETFLGALILVIVISLVGGFFFRKRHLHRTALALGFENAAALQKARKAGFASAQEQREIQALGFLTRESHQLAIAAGFSTAQALVDSWQSAPPTFQAKIPDEEIQGALRTIQDTTSPTQLARVEEELASLLTRISRAQDQLTENLTLQQDITTLFRKMKLAQLIPIDAAQLQVYQKKTAVILQLFQQYETDIQTALLQRREWFAPWPRLLTLIQVTEDRMPIALNRIAEIVVCDEPRAETFLITLLQEDESIGEYDQTQQVFTKGRDLVAVLDRYLQRVHQELGDIFTVERE